MGNYASSCKLPDQVVLPTTLPKSTKVVLPTGEIRKLQHPIKAAELMMDSPNFFVVNANTLKIGRRFCPLNADDDLERANNVYVLFPMHRKNSVVTANDLGPLLVSANSFVVKRGSTGNLMRVLPDSAGEAVSPDAADMAALRRLDLESIEEISTPEFRHRMSMSRSKRPLLETIQEEPSPRKGNNAFTLELLLINKVQIHGRR